MMIVAVVRGLMMKHIGSGSTNAHIRVDLGLMRVQQNIVAVAAAERETGRLLRGGGRGGRRGQLLLMRLVRRERHRRVVALVFAHRVEVPVALLVNCEQCALALCAVLCDECCLVAEDVVATLAEVHRTHCVTDIAINH